MIDVHHHFFPPAYLEELFAFAQAGQVPPHIRNWTPQASLAAMDRAGVRTAMLSIPVRGNWFNGTSEVKRRWARLCNDFAAELVREHPSRFGLFAAMPMPDVDAALDEIAYALDDLRADGIGFMTSYDDVWPGDPRFEPIWQELDRRRALVYVHPLAPACCEGLDPAVPSAVLEYPYDTGRAILSLLYRGVLSRYPNVRWLFSHAGGTIPFLAGRIEATSTMQGPKHALPHGVAHELRRLYYETATSLWPATMAALLAYVPLKQVLFGTDFPYFTLEESVAALERCGLTEAQREAIASRNAAALFRARAV